MIIVTRKRPEYRCGIEYNGKPLILIPASKKDFEEIMETVERYNEKSANEQLAVAYKLLALILSSNTDGAVITEEDVSGVDAMTAAEVIREYVDFMRGVRNLPN